MLLSPICVCRKEQGQGTVSHAGSLCADADSALVSLVCSTHEPCLPRSPRQGKTFPAPVCLAAQPAFFRIHEDPSAPAPWLFQLVDFVQSPGRAFCDPAPASPCFRTSDKRLAKGLRSSRLQGPQEIGLSLSFGFACRPPNAFAGIRTDIPTSYQTQYS